MSDNRRLHKFSVLHFHADDVERWGLETCDSYDEALRRVERARADVNDPDEFTFVISLVLEVS